MMFIKPTTYKRDRGIKIQDETSLAVTNVSLC